VRLLSSLFSLPTLPTRVFMILVISYSLCLPTAKAQWKKLFFAAVILLSSKLERFKNILQEGCNLLWNILPGEKVKNPLGYCS
jgi:hypothetical protein